MYVLDAGPSRHYCSTRGLVAISSSQRHRRRRRRRSGSSDVALDTSASTVALDRFLFLPPLLRCVCSVAAADDAHVFVLSPCASSCPYRLWWIIRLTISSVSEKERVLRTCGSVR